MTTPAALSTFDTGFHSRFASGLAISVLIHLGMGLLVIGRSSVLSGRASISESLLQQELESQSVRPGIAFIPLHGPFPACRINYRSGPGNAGDGGAKAAAAREGLSIP